jgi:hypothetical protein
MDGNEVDDTLAARVLIEDLLIHGPIGYELKKEFSAIDVRRIGKRLATAFSLDEIQQLFDQAKASKTALEQLLRGDEFTDTPGALQKKRPHPTKNPSSITRLPAKPVKASAT